jgi:putative flippase GtrA
VRYLVASAVTLAIDLGLLHGLLDVGVDPLLAQALALAAATPLSFALNRSWSFT